VIKRKFRNKIPHAHRYTQIHTGTHRYTQIHTDTHRYTQIHTDTHRYTQIHTDTHRYTQIHTDTYPIIQNAINFSHIAKIRKYQIDNILLLNRIFPYLDFIVEERKKDVFGAVL
jgi:hypothetical protein